MKKITGQELFRIAITGPESTGKTTLARALARRLDTLWAPEFARYYLPRLGRPYLPEDLPLMLSGQLRWESQMAQRARRFLFCDTEPLVYKIWSLESYGYCDPLIEEACEQKPYTHYFLCNTDLNWQYDPLREHPDAGDRQRLFERYQDELSDAGASFSIISGQDPEQRFLAAFKELCRLELI